MPGPIYDRTIFNHALQKTLLQKGKNAFKCVCMEINHCRFCKQGRARMMMKWMKLCKFLILLFSVDIESKKKKKVWDKKESECD